EAAIGLACGQRKYPAAEARDRSAEPFEVMKAMADEIAEEATATAAVRLPAVLAQSRCLILDIPVDDDMAQPPDRSAIEQLLRAPPRRQFGKVEVDDGRPSALARRF